MDADPALPANPTPTTENALDAIIIGADPEVLAANRAGQLHFQQRVVLTHLLWKMLGYGVLSLGGGGLLTWVTTSWQRYGVAPNLPLTAGLPFLGVVISAGSVLFFFQSFNLWRDLHASTVFCVEGLAQPKFHASKPKRRGRRTLPFYSVTVNKRIFYISAEVYAALQSKHYRFYYTPSKRLVFLERLRR